MVEYEWHDIVRSTALELSVQFLVYKDQGFQTLFFQYFLALSEQCLLLFFLALFKIWFFLYLIIHFLAFVCCG